MCNVCVCVCDGSQALASAPSPMLNYYSAFQHISQLLPPDCVLVSEGANTMDVGRTMILNRLPRHRSEPSTYTGVMQLITCPQ